MFFPRAIDTTGSLIRHSLLWAMALVLSCSLILTGGLIWINNTWAMVQDNDPDTSFDVSIIFDGMDGKTDLSDLDPDGDGQIPLAGGKLLKGNGGFDDNKPDPILITGRAVVLVTPSSFPAPLLVQENRVIKSYLDFGHLKIFPDASSSYIYEMMNTHGNKAAALSPRGGLFLCQIGLVYV